MKAFVLGIDHTTQYQDNEGRLQAIIRKLCNDHNVTLVAEEWIATGYDDTKEKDWTVGRRLKEELSVAWLNIEVGDRARKKLGILEDLERRHQRIDAMKGCVVQEIHSHVYFPRADCLREQRWLRKIVRHKHNSSALVLCGNIHVKPFALKLHEAGFSVATGSLCEYQWYRDWQYSKCAEVEARLVDERY